MAVECFENDHFDSNERGTRQNAAEIDPVFTPCAQSGVQPIDARPCEKRPGANASSLAIESQSATVGWRLELKAETIAALFAA